MDELAQARAGVAKLEGQIAEQRATLARLQTEWTQLDQEWDRLTLAADVDGAPVDAEIETVAQERTNCELGQRRATSAIAELERRLVAAREAADECEYKEHVRKLRELYDHDSSYNAAWADAVLHLVASAHEYHEHALAQRRLRHQIGEYQRNHGLGGLEFGGTLAALNLDYIVHWCKDANGLEQAVAKLEGYLPDGYEVS